MGDLISRAKAIAMHKTECSGECGCCKYITQDFECGILINVPAVDAEPVRHGRWKSVKEPGKWGYTAPMCSECGLVDFSGTFRYFNYCPNCGAKMRCNDETE